MGHDDHGPTAVEEGSRLHKAASPHRQSFRLTCLSEALLLRQSDIARPDMGSGLERLAVMYFDRDRASLTAFVGDPFRLATTWFGRGQVRSRAGREKGGGACCVALCAALRVQMSVRSMGRGCATREPLQPERRSRENSLAWRASTGVAELRLAKTIVTV